MPRAVLSVTHQNCNHDLMHRKDHGGRRACPPQHVTYIDHVGDAGPFPSKINRDQDAEQPLFCVRPRTLPQETARRGRPRQRFSSPLRLPSRLGL